MSETIISIALSRNLLGTIESIVTLRWTSNVAKHFASLEVPAQVSLS